jgi:hypothetical protein
MHDDEENDGRRADEMDGARGLSPAEDVEKRGEGRVHAGRHGKPGQKHKRQKHDRDGEIGEFLQNIVALGLFALGKLEPRVLADRGADMRKVVARGRKIAPEMAAAEAPQEVGEAVEQEQPSEEEVPAPSHGEVAISG